jgi:hypothetical protein
MTLSGDHKVRSHANMLEMLTFFSIHQSSVTVTVNKSSVTVTGSG